MACAAVLLVRLPPPLPALHPGKRGGYKVGTLFRDHAYVVLIPNWAEMGVRIPFFRYVRQNPRVESDG